MIDEREMIRNEGEKLACEAGRLAWQLFINRTGEALPKGSAGDIVTQADYDIENFLIARIQALFPHHSIQSEERGFTGHPEAQTKWLIDPLDGTNNFAIGLPAFGVALSVIMDGELSFAFVYICSLDRCYVAERGKGVSVNGQPYIKSSYRKIRPQLTLAWAQGYSVSNSQLAFELVNQLRLKSYRVLELWAPTVCWALLVEGTIDGFLIYDNETEDLYPGLLLAHEVGMALLASDGQTIEDLTQLPKLVIACKPELKDQLMAQLSVSLRDFR